MLCPVACIHRESLSEAKITAHADDLLFFTKVGVSLGVGRVTIGERYPRDVALVDDIRHVYKT